MMLIKQADSKWSWDLPTSFLRGSHSLLNVYVKGHYTIWYKPSNPINKAPKCIII